MFFFHITIISHSQVMVWGNQNIVLAVFHALTLVVEMFGSLKYFLLNIH